MKDQVLLINATKSIDWKCTGGINAGDDSYRAYESESVNQRVIVDGKNEAYCLKILTTNAGSIKENKRASD